MFLLLFIWLHNIFINCNDMSILITFKWAEGYEILNNPLQPQTMVNDIKKNNQPIPVHFFRLGILLTNNTKSVDNITTTTKTIGIALIGLTE